MGKVTPAAEWLAARLAKGPCVPQETLDEGVLAGFSIEDLDLARRELRVVTSRQTPAAGGRPYDVWVISSVPNTGFQKGYDPRRHNSKPPTVAAVAAPLPPPAKYVKPDPKKRVERAKERLQRHAVRHVRFLEELTERVARDPVKCPTCGRGTPRDEANRLRAIIAALDKAGIGNPKGGPDSEESGPAIVFPPGTRIGLVADVPAPPPPPELVAVRVDTVAN